MFFRRIRSLSTDSWQIDFRVVTIVSTTSWFWVSFTTEFYNWISQSSSHSSINLWPLTRCITISQTSHWSNPVCRSILIRIMYRVQSGLRDNVDMYSDVISRRHPGRVWVVWHQWRDSSGEHNVTPVLHPHTWTYMLHQHDQFPDEGVTFTDRCDHTYMSSTTLTTLSLLTRAMKRESPWRFSTQ